MKAAIIVVLTAIVTMFGCAFAGGDSTSSDDQAWTVDANAVAYNTPGPQYGPDGGLLGTRDNPFALRPANMYADATHAESWAVDALAEYGTFHQPVTLSGVLQYKWIRCGNAGAGC